MLGTRAEKGLSDVALNAERKTICAGEPMKSKAQNVTRLLLFLSVFSSLLILSQHRKIHAAPGLFCMRVSWRLSFI